MSGSDMTPEKHRNNENHKARKSCSAEGASLAYIDNEDENSYVSNLCATDHCWIGGHDFKENDWVWTNWETITYLKWNDGEPNGVQNENCIWIYGPPATNDRPGKWNDHRCGDLAPYICKI